MLIIQFQCKICNIWWIHTVLDACIFLQTTCKWFPISPVKRFVKFLLQHYMHTHYIRFACLSIERWLHVVGNVKLIFKRNFYSIKNILSHIQLETTWFNPLNKYKKLVLKCRRNLIPKEVRLFIFSWVQSTSENLITEMNLINNV